MDALKELRAPKIALRARSATAKQARFTPCSLSQRVCVHSTFVRRFVRIRRGAHGVSPPKLRDALARVMTGKRVELLHYVRRHKVTSVRALAKALRRDYSNVHADVQALTGAGILDTADGGVQADYDVIETK